MAIDISRIDINRISEKGIYLDPLGNSINLSDEEIIAIRNLYHNNFIARKRLNYNKHYTVKIYKNKLDKKYNIDREEQHLGMIGYKKTRKKPIEINNIMGIDLIDGIPIRRREKSSSQKRLETIQNNYEREKFIRKYAYIYRLNYDIVYQTISKITNNFTSLEYLEKGKIAKIDIFDQGITANTQEELLLLIIREIKLNPGKFGLYKGDIHFTKEDEENTYLSFIDYYSKVLGVDKYLVAALIHTETGFDSESFNEYKNPANLKIGSRLKEFDTIEEGIIEVCIQLKLLDIKEITQEELKKYNEDKYWLDNIMYYYNYYKENEEIFTKEMKGMII